MYLLPMQSPLGDELNEEMVSNSMEAWARFCDIIFISDTTVVRA